MNNQLAAFAEFPAVQQVFKQYQQSNEQLIMKLHTPQLQFERIMANGTQLQIHCMGNQTSFIVSEGSGRTLYFVHGEFQSYDDAVLGLFKKVILDDSQYGITYYELVKGYFVDYFKNMVNNPVPLTLTGKWKGLFVHLEIENVIGMEGSFLSMQVHGKELMVSLNTHPLVEHLG